MWNYWTKSSKRRRSCDGVSEILRAIEEEGLSAVRTILHCACSEVWSNRQANSLYTSQFLFIVPIKYLYRYHAVSLCVMCLLTIIPRLCRCTRNKHAVILIAQVFCSNAIEGCMLKAVFLYDIHVSNNGKLLAYIWD
jgi:hypothetical protein